MKADKLRSLITAGKAYQLRRGVSSVLLVGKDGRVAFAAEGSLPAEQRRRLVQILREQVEG